MLNNNLSKILVICYLFANINSINYSMEYNFIQDDDTEFNLIKDDNITTQQLHNTNNNNKINSGTAGTQINSGTIGAQTINNNTELNKNNSVQITQLSNQIAKLFNKNKVELLTQAIQRNKFIETLQTVYYIIDSKYLSITNNLDTDSRSNLLKFLTSNFKKTKCIVANNEKQMQYLMRKME